MTNDPKTPTPEPAPDKKADHIDDLPPKQVSREDAENTKGGRRPGGGTQTEDEVYVG